MHKPSRQRRSTGTFSVIWRRFHDEHLMQVAAALAFTTLLALVPLVTLILAVAGVSTALGHLLSSLELLIRQTLLPGGVAGTIAGNISAFSHKAQGLTIPGLALLGVTAFMLLHTIERAFNHLWQVAPRPLWSRIRLYALVLLVGPFLMAAVVAAVTYAVSLSLGLFAEPPVAERVVLRYLLPALLILFFALLYHAIPNARVSPWAALGGGGLATLGFVGLQKVFELYLVKSALMKSIYGAFAAIPVFLVWLHLSWVVILLGGLFVATRRPPVRSGAAGRAR